MMEHTWKQKLWKMLVEGEPAVQGQQPITGIAGGGTENNPFLRMGLAGTSSDDPMRRVADRMRLVKLWRTTYLQNGGPIAECIDAYPLFALSNGWKLSCEPGAEGLKDLVQEWLDQPQVDLDSVMWQGIVDALVCGTAFQEIVPNRGGGVYNVLSRDASTFWIDYKETGEITGYRQFIPLGNSQQKEIKITQPQAMANIITITLFPTPGEVYGSSLIGRAWHEILRDLDVVESITKAIHRHGTPKNVWKVGSDTQPAGEADLKSVKSEITKIEANTDYVVSNTDVNMLDTSGIPGVDTYSNVSLQRLACALGVPEEIIGLGRGSTEATANVRQRAFLDKVSTIQEIIARTYTRKVIDRITGQPGMVWIEFNDPNPEDLLKKAQWVAALRNSGMDSNAICDDDWCRKEFGIPPRDDTPDQMPDTKKPKPDDQQKIVDEGAPVYS